MEIQPLNVVYPSEVPAREPHLDALKEAMQNTTSKSTLIILEKPIRVAEDVVSIDPPQNKLDANPPNLGLETLEKRIIDIEDTKDALKKNDLSLKEAE